MDISLADTKSLQVFEDGDRRLEIEFDPKDNWLERLIYRTPKFTHELKSTVLPFNPFGLDLGQFSQAVMFYLKKVEHAYEFTHGVTVGDLENDEIRYYALGYVLSIVTTEIDVTDRDRSAAELLDAARALFE